MIGGAAGAVPVLVGWAAVTDSLDWPPLVLFAVIFLWTPPHFWALAIRYADDYRAADVPMLPAVADAATVGRHDARLHRGAVGAASLLLVPGGRPGLALRRRRARARRWCSVAGCVDLMRRLSPGPVHAPVHVVDHLRHPAVRRPWPWIVLV